MQKKFSEFVCRIHNSQLNWSSQTILNFRGSFCSVTWFSKRFWFRCWCRGFRYCSPKDSTINKAHPWFQTRVGVPLFCHTDQHIHQGRWNSLRIWPWRILVFQVNHNFALWLRDENVKLNCEFKLFYFIFVSCPLYSNYIFVHFTM